MGDGVGKPKHAQAAGGKSSELMQSTAMNNMAFLMNSESSTQEKPIFSAVGKHKENPLDSVIHGPYIIISSFNIYL
jgi:hypothetical protein